MSVTTNATEIVARFSEYITRLTALCESHAIGGWKAPLTLVKEWRSNLEFREEWNRVWSDLIASEGGKVSLMTAAMIIGSVLGSMGIAAFGGAIGLPLAAVLVPLAYVAGDEVDGRGWTQRVWSWKWGKSAERDSPPESQTMLQTGADLDALTTSFDVRCGQMEEQLSGVSKSLGDLASKIAHLSSSVSSMEQRVSELSSKAVTLGRVSGMALLLGVIAAAWLFVKQLFPRLLSH
jgi:hypothetical protein